MLEIVKSFLRNGEPLQDGFVQGKYYQRSGSCNRCGKCCTNIYLVYNRQTITSIPMFESIKAENPEYESFKPMLEDSDEDGILFQCTHLQADNTCGAYEDRPDFCRQYPSEHGLLLGGKLAKGCGYSFKLLKNFQTVLQQVSDKGNSRAFKLDNGEIAQETSGILLP